MATKINVRSPFYLTVDEPAEVTPTFTCSTANIQGLTISKEGVISTPVLDFGIFNSFIVSGQSYSNGQFPTVTSNTSRTFDVRIDIPAGFANSDDAYIDCPQSIIQPKQDTGVGDPCENGVSSSGTIPAQSLETGGNTATINLSSYFSGSPTSYTIQATDSLVNTGVSGTTLTISSNNRAGTQTVIVQANDASGCNASQSFSVSVSFPAQEPRTLACGDIPLNGGRVNQDGTIVKPSSIVSVGSIRTSENGTVVTSVAANSGGSPQNVTLYFDLVVPSGYSNAGTTLSCPKTFSQPNALPEFTCDIANLTGQAISASGDIRVGQAGVGTIASYSPLQFDEVSDDISRDVTFNVTIPSGYSNSGTHPCVKTLKQPGKVQTAGANTFYLTTPQREPASTNFCDAIYRASTEVTSDASTVTTLEGTRVFKNGTTFNGQNLLYGVSKTRVNVGYNQGAFYAIQIDTNGVVLQTFLVKCRDKGDGSDKNRDEAIL